MKLWNDTFIPAFRGLSSSLISQGNVEGTAHPNGAGQRNTADAVLRDVDLSGRAPEPETFIVAVDKLVLTKADDSDLPAKQRWRFGPVAVRVLGVSRRQCIGTVPGADVPGGQCTLLRVKTPGRTVALRSHVKIDRFAESNRQDPAEPHVGHGVSADLIAQRFHLRGNDWDFDRAQRIVDTSPGGRLELRYRVFRDDGSITGPLPSPIRPSLKLAG